MVLLRLCSQVDDKYQYSCENKDLRVHGWISMESPPVGFWQITPSDEFRSGGPLKQNLSSHVGPTCLAVSILYPPRLILTFVLPLRSEETFLEAGFLHF